MTNKQIQVVNVPVSNNVQSNIETENNSSTTQSKFTSITTSVDREDGELSQVPSQTPVTLFQLSRRQRIVAGSGHILNDLCASLWFTYFLLYMQKVVKFNDTYAAGLLFWGQIVDGIATPLVGYETDHVASLWPCSKSYGRCKSWHLLGIVLVTISFPFVFSPCIGYSLYTDEWSKVADWKKAVYYAPFIAVFQIGWASTQISHLALIPKLTPDDLIRTEMLAIRYAFTVAANMSVFILTWLFLTNLGHHAKCDIGTNDSSSFSFIGLISVALGGIFSILFHFFVVEKSDHVVKSSVSMLKVQESENNIPVGNSNAAGDNEASGSHGTPSKDERMRRNRTPTDLRSGREGTQALLGSDTEDDHEPNTSNHIRKRGSTSTQIIQPVASFSTKSLNAGKENMGVGDWLKLPQFYNVACLYLSTRLSVNLSQSYMPLYVETSLGLGCGAVAVIPLIMYSSGFAVSLVIKLLNKYLGRQIAYAIGAFMIVSGACLILFLDFAANSNAWGIYIVAILIGGGSSAILVTSLSITADLIGNNIESGAFVYGAMSFCDKISCGVGVVLISSLNPCTDEKNQCAGSDSKEFYTNALGYSSGGSAIAGLIFTLLLTILIMRKSRAHSSGGASEIEAAPVS